MDNFEKLFGSSRKNQQKTTEFRISEKDFSDFVSAEWYKLMLIGLRHYQEKNFRGALDSLDKAIAQKPDHPHLLNVRANVKEDSGDAKGAIDDYRESLSISGSDWYSYYNQIAINYLKLQQFQKSLLAFDIAYDLKRALESNGVDERDFPSNLHGVVLKVAFERILTNRANVKLSLGNIEGCYNDCQKAYQINPNYAASHFLIGLLCVQLNQIDDARQALTQAHKLGHPQAMTILNELRYR